MQIPISNNHEMSTIMESMMTLWNDVLDIGREHAAQGECACKAFPHVTNSPEFFEATEEMLTTLGLVLDLSRPDEAAGNVGHLITAILAVGYALGASSAYDVSLSSDVSVPDSLAGLDLIEPRPGDRPASE